MKLVDSLRLAELKQAARTLKQRQSAPCSCEGPMTCSSCHVRNGSLAILSDPDRILELVKSYEDVVREAEKYVVFED